jgi:hypothetical protein
MDFKDSGVRKMSFSDNEDPEQSHHGTSTFSNYQNFVKHPTQPPPPPYVSNINRLHEVAVSNKDLNSECSDIDDEDQIEGLQIFEEIMTPLIP